MNPFRNLWEQVKSRIRTRSREEWEGVVLDAWGEVRSWVQEHAELGLLLGFACGIILVLLIKLVAFIALCLSVVAAVIWYTAEPRR